MVEKSGSTLLLLDTGYRLENELRYDRCRDHSLTAHQRTAYSSRNKAVYQYIRRSARKLPYTFDIAVKRRHNALFFKFISVHKFTSEQVSPIITEKFTAEKHIYDVEIFRNM